MPQCDRPRSGLDPFNGTGPAAAFPVHINHQSPAWPVQIMNNGTIENPGARLRPNDATDELTKLKKDLLHAEVRLAKARATVTGAEIDIKLLNARLKMLMK